MNSKMIHAPARTILPGIVAYLLFAPGIATSQVPVDESGVPLQSLDSEATLQHEGPASVSDLSASELEDLAGPVALYPDDLLAIVLPASTYPLEIVQAARFLEQLEADSSLQPDDSWDESITALLNYPEVVRMMDEDIDWTWRLGEAVIAQQEALIAAIESFRDRAYAAGNLKSDEYQEVSNDDGVIEIVPVDEEIIYVPYYEPEEVVVYQPRQVYYYYPQAYPVYYYPYPVGHRFSSGFFWGVTTAFSIGWNNDYLHVYHPSYWGHPYYGRSYYSHYYRRPSINVYNTWYVNNSRRSSRYRYRDGDYWRPRYRSGARPQDQRVRNHHYPSQNRNAVRTANATTRLQARNDGRLSLGLRERNRNDRTAATGQSRQRQDRLAANTVNRRQLRGAASNTDQNIRRSSSDGPAIRFRDRQQTDTVRATRNTAQQALSNTRQQRRAATAPAAGPSDRSSANRQVTNQRRVSPANDTLRRVSAAGAANQRQRTQVNSNTTATATPVSRAPTRQQVQRSANRSQPRSVQRRVSVANNNLQRATAATRQAAPAPRAPAQQQTQHRAERRQPAAAQGRNETKPRPASRQRKRK